MVKILNPYFIQEFRVLNLQTLGEDDYYSYDPTIDFGHVNIGYVLLQRCWKKIQALNKAEIASPIEVLQTIYKHILWHEAYHYRSKNKEVIELKHSGRELSESEVQMIRDEEMAAEYYALAKSRVDADAFRLYYSVLLGTIVDSEIIRENLKGKEAREDLFHMADSEILSLLRPSILSEDQETILLPLEKRVARD